VLRAGGYATALALAPGAAVGAPSDHLVRFRSQKLLDDLEQRTFAYFWQTTDTANGLAPDRWPTPSPCSIAAVGFALTAYPIGIERGWITRAQGRDRVLTTLRFLREIPQGPEPFGRSGYRGFFYHFLDMQSGARFNEEIELSTMDTALLLAGVLFCQTWFDGSDASEAEIRRLAYDLYARVDWRWMQARAPAICQAWQPGLGFAELDWKGYNEAMLVYVLALASPTFAVEPAAWMAWTSTYAESWTSFYGQEHLHFAPLFGHQYSHCWVDFRGIRDEYMAARDLDYFENSRRAAHAQRAYARANPMRWNGYGDDLWGISACDGPADLTLMRNVEFSTYRSYAGRGAGGAHTYDDGTIAPYAAIASLPFAPEIVRPALQTMVARLGAHVYGNYGFFDAFNLSFDYDVPLRHGRRIPGWGWVDIDYLGIDQGPILAMLANYRNELVWRVMRNNRYIRRGLLCAGFGGGWLV
jgi:hypothetical protein